MWVEYVNVHIGAIFPKIIWTHSSSIHIFSFEVKKNYRTLMYYIIFRYCRRGTICVVHPKKHTHTWRITVISRRYISEINNLIIIATDGSFDIYHLFNAINFIKYRQQNLIKQYSLSLGQIQIITLRMCRNYQKCSGIAVDAFQIYSRTGIGRYRYLLVSCPNIVHFIACGLFLYMIILQQQMNFFFK